MSIQSWTYSGDPSASTLDRVRFLVGDTDTDDRQVADEEVLFCISEVSDAYAAAAMVARTIAARYSREVSKQVGDLRISAEQRQQHYTDLARQYEDRAGISGAALAAAVTPFAGGISQADRDSEARDTDRIAPAFTVGMHDMPGSASGSTSRST